MSYANRVERDLERRDAELWTEHEAGWHADIPEPSCARCGADAREALNREGQPEFNGAFRS